MIRHMYLLNFCPQIRIHLSVVILFKPVCQARVNALVFTLLRYQNIFIMYHKSDYFYQLHELIFT